MATKGGMWRFGDGFTVAVVFLYGESGYLGMGLSN